MWFSRCSNSQIENGTLIRAATWARNGLRNFVHPWRVQRPPMARNFDRPRGVQLRPHGVAQLRVANAQDSLEFVINPQGSI
jgi:hypothetical protein